MLSTIDALPSLVKNIVLIPLHFMYRFYRNCFTILGGGFADKKWSNVNTLVKIPKVELNIQNFWD